MLCYYCFDTWEQTFDDRSWLSVVRGQRRANIPSPSPQSLHLGD